MLKHQKLEIFAQELARGRSSREAAEIAGYRPGTSFADNARKRSHRRDVKERVRQLARAAGVEVDSAYVQRQLVSIVETPTDKPCLVSDKIAALNLLAKIKGLFAPEKHDHTLAAFGDLGARLDRAINRVKASTPSR